MKEWSVEFEKGAQRDLARLERETRRRIIDKLFWLAENFESVAPESLQGEWSDFYKLRVGDWRVKYKIDYGKQILFVVYVDRRDSAYKKRR